MSKISQHLFRFSIILLLTLSACSSTLAPQNISETNADVPHDEADATSTSEPVQNPNSTPTSLSLPTEQEKTPGNETPTEALSPENQGVINPLTGLPAQNPDYLDLPPALVSISNFPASGRPQAGLSFSPITFEIAIGEGMTRFLAMFYGQFPGTVSGQTEGDTATIGPIRSGRLSYEDIRATYSGFLVMASAWEGISTNLNDSTSVYGTGDDINSATVNSDRLIEIARSEAQGYPGSNFSLEGMTFSEAPPEDGQKADQAWVYYSLLNQVQWRYDETAGAYVRYDIKTDGSGEFEMSTDRLNGRPVSRENVVVIFAEHDYQAPTLIDIDLINKPPTEALLFRNGMVYNIFWTTRFGDYEKETGLLRPMRFVDENGSPIPLKPGQTWISVVSMDSYYLESALSKQPFFPVIEDEGTGLWLIRYKGKY